MHIWPFFVFTRKVSLWLLQGYYSLVCTVRAGAISEGATWASETHKMPILRSDHLHPTPKKLAPLWILRQLSRAKRRTPILLQSTTLQTISSLDPLFLSWPSLLLTIIWVGLHRIQSTKPSVHTQAIQHTRRIQNIKVSEFDAEPCRIGRS